MNHKGPQSRGPSYAPLQLPCARDDTTIGQGCSWPGPSHTVGLGLNGQWQHFVPLGFDSSCASDHCQFQLSTTYPTSIFTGPVVCSETTFNVVDPPMYHTQYWPTNMQPPNMPYTDQGSKQTLDIGPDAHLFTSSDSSPDPTRPVIPDETATHQIADEVHRCPHGCIRAFRRPGDYRRHMRKHDRPRYKCPKFDCDKTFYRADKMRDHIRQGHKGFTL